MKHIKEASYNLSKLFRNILGKDQELFDFEAFQEYLNDSKFDEEFEMPSESLFTVEGLANIGAKEAYDIEESIVLTLNDMHNYGYRLADKSSDQVVDMLADYFDRVGGKIPIEESKLNKKLQECSLYSIPWEVYNINNLQDAKIVAEENFIFSYKDGEFNSEMGNLYKLAYNLNIPRENIDAYIMPLVYPRNKIKESTNKKGKNMKKFNKPLKESALEDLKFDVNVRVYKRSNYLDEHLTGTYDEVYNEFRAIKGDKKINSISIEGKRFPELESIFDDYILRDMLEASDSFNDFDRLVNKWRKEGKPNQFSKLIKESRLRKLLEDEEEIEIEDESAYIPEEEPIIQRVSNNDEFELISAGDMDEPINELPVYDVMAQDLSDKPFYLVIDNDGDEDDGVIITVPENDDEGASLEAAMEIVQKIVDNIPTEIVMEEDENGDEVEKEVEVPVEIIENDDNSVTIKGDLDKILDAIVGEVGREEIMADISTGKDVDVEVTSIVEESLVQKRINLVRKLQESKEITLLNTKKNEKHTYTDNEFSKYFSDEIRRVEEKIIDNNLFTPEEDEDGYFTAPDLNMVLDYWNDYSDDWTSPQGVKPIWQLVDAK